MKLDSNNRPICIGTGPSRPCGQVLHPGYTICTNCKRPYDGDENRWAEAELRTPGAGAAVIDMWRAKRVPALSADSDTPAHLDGDGRELWKMCDWVLTGGDCSPSTGLQMQAMAIRRELRLESANAELRGWKESATLILHAWEEVGESLGGVTVRDLGRSKAEIALREAKRLKEANAAMMDLIERAVADRIDDNWLKDARVAITNAKGEPKCK